MNKKILIIQGNPNVNSLCDSIAERYKLGAEKSNAEVKLFRLTDMKFDPILKEGYKKEVLLEEDLQTAQYNIKWADHLVFVYPTWWGTVPALLKGFIDRVFLPGFAFKYRKGSPWWDKFLTGKSARLLVTMDTPVWYYKWFYGSPGHNAMKKNTLEFCGVKPVKISSFGPVRFASPEKIQSWLDESEKLGKCLH